MLVLFRFFAAFSINLDLAAPGSFRGTMPVQTSPYSSLLHFRRFAECAVKSITYPLKWAFVELLPVFAAIALLVVYAVVYLYKRMCLNIPSEKRHAHLSQLIACVIVSK